MRVKSDLYFCWWCFMKKQIEDITFCFKCKLYEEFLEKTNQKEKYLKWRVEEHKKLIDDAIKTLGGLNNG